MIHFVSTSSLVPSICDRSTARRSSTQTRGARWLRLAVLTVASLVAATTGARAQTDNSVGSWWMLFATGDFGGVDENLEDVRWWFDFQPRFSDAVGGLDQLLIRPGLGWRFAERATAWLGYARIDTRSGSGTVGEDRIWQQLTWSTDLGSVRFASRTRLEQRFVETGSDVGWRFRQFFKLVRPFEFEPRLRLTAYDEVFFALNNTDWGERTGFRQNRLFAGLGWSFDDAGKVVTEIGYLNQFVNANTLDDQMVHILSVNLLLRF